MNIRFKRKLISFIKSYFLIRRSLLLLFDNLLLQLSFLGTLSIIENDFISKTYKNHFLTFFTYSLIASIIYIFSGQYKSLTRYLNTNNLYKIIIRNFVIIILIFLINSFTKTIFISFNDLIIIWIFSSLSIGLFKFVIKDLLTITFMSEEKKSNKVIIFGAGSAGAQLASSLKIEGKYKIYSFIDENPQLWKRFLNGIPINSIETLNSIKENVNQILVAIPSLNSKNKKRILNLLKVYDIPILEVPSIDMLTSGKAKINSLKPISIEALLGREKVMPIKSLFGPSIKGRSICITGAGGSIGSELSKQIFNLEPTSVILIDNSEPNLYKIYEELKMRNKKGIYLKGQLCNVCDYKSTLEIFTQEKIDIVFHAAAYKHVPLVEENPLEGLFNNIFSTHTICRSAKDSSVSQVMLISSDKAVRPTNIMGVSKRISELIIQAFAEDNNNENIISKPNCLYSMVRFGNVLDSSGSVIPLFKQQITNGGPITLTDIEMTRYFMTIPEAAQLVIQSSVLAEGGDVFLLDMGEPIKILELAKQMIFLSGLSLKDNNNPNGDIEIKITGKRPGEKLYEELLINAESQVTLHPLIYKAKEKKINKQVLFEILENIRNNIISRDKNKCFNLVKKLVPEWDNMYLDK